MNEIEFITTPVKHRGHIRGSLRFLFVFIIILQDRIDLQRAVLGISLPQEITVLDLSKA
jgi:hypothetical protein